MRRTLVLAAVLLAGCDAFRSAPKGVLATPADAYPATLGTTWIRAEIPVTVENTGGETLWLTGCARPDPPHLEKRVGGAWTPAYLAVVTLCLAEPVPVEPGDTFRYTYEMVAARPGRSAVPEWLVGDVPGTYRLRWQAGTDDGGLDLVSGPFELTVR